MKDLNDKKILIVDDEPLLRELLRSEFEHYGAQVTEAEDGRQAFEMIENQHFDGVLSDIRMAGGDGIELLSNIRKRKPPNPIVVLMTGHSDLSEEDALAGGASAIFSKPFDIHALISGFQKLLV